MGRSDSMTVLVAAVAGFLAGRLVWVSLRPALANSVFERSNFRERVVPTAGGLVVPLAILLVESGRVVLGAAGIGDAGPTAPRLGVLIAVTGFALLGLVDDLSPGGDARGFRGHLGALGRGHLTTGAAKLVGGGATALVVTAAVARSDDLVGVVRDAVLIALAANLGNLLDRAPGRMLKASTVSLVGLVVATSGAAVLGPVVLVVAAGVALLLDDLHERVMLGDTGANALGAALGVGAVMATSPAVRTSVVVVLLLLNAASEAVSFGRVIDSVPPLRAFDRAGRRA